MSFWVFRHMHTKCQANTLFCHSKLVARARKLAHKHISSLSLSLSLNFHTLKLLGIRLLMKWHFALTLGKVQVAYRCCCCWCLFYVVFAALRLLTTYYTELSNLISLRELHLQFAQRRRRRRRWKYMEYRKFPTRKKKNRKGTNEHLIKHFADDIEFCIVLVSWCKNNKAPDDTRCAYIQTNQLLSIRYNMKWGSCHSFYCLFKYWKTLSHCVSPPRSSELIWIKIRGQ